MINIAVMGYGTVGSGVVEVIRTNGSLIDERLYRMRFMKICTGSQRLSGRSCGRDSDA